LFLVSAPRTLRIWQTHLLRLAKREPSAVQTDDLSAAMAARYEFAAIAASIFGMTAEISAAVARTE